MRCVDLNSQNCLPAWPWLIVITNRWDLNTYWRNHVRKPWFSLWQKDLKNPKHLYYFLYFNKLLQDDVLPHKINWYSFSHIKMIKAVEIRYEHCRNVRAILSNCPGTWCTQSISDGTMGSFHSSGAWFNWGLGCDLKWSQDWALDQIASVQTLCGHRSHTAFCFIKEMKQHKLFLESNIERWRMKLTDYK